MQKRRQPRRARAKTPSRVRPDWFAAASGAVLAAVTLAIWMVAFAGLALVMPMSDGVLSAIAWAGRVCCLFLAGWWCARRAAAMRAGWCCAAGLGFMVILHSVFFFTTRQVAPLSVWFWDAALGLCVAGVTGVLVGLKMKKAEK